MSTNEQLAWDFDDGDVAEVRPDTGIARFAPGSEQWIAALQPTDDDAIRLDRFDVNTMTAEAAARLWARVGDCGLSSEGNAASSRSRQRMRAS